MYLDYEPCPHVNQQSSSSVQVECKKQMQHRGEVKMMQNSLSWTYNAMRQTDRQDKINSRQKHRERQRQRKRQKQRQVAVELHGHSIA